MRIISLSTGMFYTSQSSVVPLCSCEARPSAFSVFLPPSSPLLQLQRLLTIRRRSRPTKSNKLELTWAAEPGFMLYDIVDYKILEQN